MVTANKPQNDRYVNRRTRAVIGLRHMGIRDMTVYARAMGMWVGRRGTSDPDCSAASKCVADVLASDNPIVKSLLQSGLPLKKSAKLGGYCQVRCPLCGATVSHVPCYTCAVRDSVKAGSAEKKRLASVGMDDGTEEWLEDWIADGEHPDRRCFQRTTNPAAKARSR
jgi:hypothetical protein